MPVRDIRAKIGIDGEREFSRAIAEAGRNMRVMASEMKAAAADFNLTGDEIEFLGRKSKNLNSQIEQQEAIVRALEDAVADAAKTYGDASSKTDGYRIKLNNAQASLSRLKKELEDSNREMTELGRDAGRVGRQLESGIGDAADDVSRKFDQMANVLGQDVASIGSSLKVMAAFQIGAEIAEGAVEIYDTLTGLVDESMEYNRTMSFLKINSEAAGHNFETIKGYAIEIAGITGDMDAAVEGVSNLLAAGLEPDELALAVTRLSAAVVRFPETLKFESLADSLQESIATGSAVGQYAEYLERMGIDLETVNKSFEEAGKNGREAVETAALAWLSDPKTEAAFDQWKIDNTEMVEYFTAQATLTDAQANLAKELTPLATEAINAATFLFDSATTAIQEAKTLWSEWKTNNAEQQKQGEAEKTAIDAETGYYSRIAELNAQIAEADLAGDIMAAARLVEERAKVQEDLIDYLKKAETTESAVPDPVDTIVKKTEQGILESLGRSMIGDYWYDYFFGNKEELDGGAEKTGQDLVSSLTDGIDAKQPDAVASIRNMMAAMQTEANKGVTIPVYRRSGSTLPTVTGPQQINVALGMDGRVFADTTAEYTSDSLGAKIDRYVMYG